MYTKNTLRDRFVDGALSTASGPRIVVMCYERLDRDLAQAIAAIEAGDRATAHDQLCHAQDLVHELSFMLDVDAWEHAGALAEIYRYVIGLLTTANVAKSTAPAIEARRLLAELGDAFRQAATAVPSVERPVTTPASLSVRA
jgi:flagellar protein FliS